MSKQIAIVGLSPSTHEDAPWGDDEWEIWGLPWDSMWEVINVYFEMHALELLKDSTILPLRYFERLNSLGNLYMQKEYYDVANAMAYPLKEVTNTIGVDYFNSSISYMLGLAIHRVKTYRYRDKPLYEPKIGLWGVDMDDKEALDPNDPSYKTEYKYQRPNLEYLIGFARGLGIEVYIPEQSSLCKFNGKGVPFGPLFPDYPKRYGFLT